MKKTIILIAILIFGLLTPLSIEVQTVKAQHTSDGKGFPLASGINITSPANTTYISNLLTLNITVRGLISPSIYRYIMVYSADGKNNASLPVTSTFVPVEATVTYPNGTITTAPAIIGSYYIITGCVALPELHEGTHNITVYAAYERTNDINTNWPALILDSNTVDFTINYGIPPVISKLSLENKTYNQNNLPLNFTTDKPISWICYCLDGKTNVTITGNTTLTGIPNGSHNIVIYANDTLGNMGASEAINFNVSQKTTLQAGFVYPIAGVVTVGIIIAIVLVLKRRTKPNRLF